jgi:hypothetical protein
MIKLRFKTGEYVNDDNTNNESPETEQMWVAVKHRAAGSSSVYFGPFESLSELSAWAIEVDMSVGAIELVNPNSPASTWWG